MSDQLAENSEARLFASQFEQLAKAIQGFKDKQAILVTFAAVLLPAVEMLEQEKAKLINQHLRLSNEDNDMYEQVANLYKIISYDCVHHNPTPATIEFAQICSRIENILRTIVQHSRGCLAHSQGYFYASEANLSQLCEASIKALEATDASEPIEFVEVK